MVLTFSQLAAVMAGLALCATGLIFPSTTKGFLRGIALAVALAMIAALLIAAARNFG